ncbi:SHOCT domain-containing protein [Halovenus rubra]|uniref:SHOCT domain-containing protein n=2 Tax=Halovenus rubra TaxID=869890 RepID=A0ABD5X4D5_9EURY|nr:SHOCT domain-containing protein [Halovenus rubra]
MLSRHWIYFTGFVITSVLFVGAGLLGVVDALSVLAGGVPASEELIVLTLLGEVIEWVIVLLVLAAVAALFLTATIVSVLRNTSMHRSDRLVSIVERLEHEYPILQEFDASERVEPTTEDRKAELREQYFEGEISDEEFERELGQLLDEDTESSQSRERTGIEFEK